jgi:hypothetical protein
MPSLFAELEKRCSAAVDALYGEPTRIDRFKKGDVFANVADSDRASFTVIGIVDFNPVTVTTKDEGSYDGFQPTIAADRIHVSYDISLFPDAAHWPIQDDVIVLTERPGTPRIRVTRPPDHDGIGRMLCVCSKA